MEKVLKKTKDHLIEELSTQAIKVITSNCSNENLSLDKQKLIN